MAKLICDNGRRVMVLPSLKTVHRSDGSPCTAQLQMAGRRVHVLVHPDTEGFILGVTDYVPPV